MSRLDLVIFGATGFTGKYTVLEAVRLSKTNSFTWGVAGRSESKLNAMLMEMGSKAGEDLSKIKKIVADVNDEESLDHMCAATKVLVNCCGPYRLYGEPVVRACVLARTHHVDVSGEPEFIETMQYKYDKKARENGVYVISACGFDSIPNDLGVVYLQQNFDGTLNSVESYVETHVPAKYRMSSSLHYGTWQSLVLGLSNWRNLKKIREKIYSEQLPSFKPKLIAKPMIHKKGGRWYVPFLGADGSVVHRTQRYFHDHLQRRPVQFRTYLKIGALLTAYLLVNAALVLYLMAKFDFTRQLLLNYPRLFSMGMASHSGPSEEASRSTRFRVTLYGRGWAGIVDTNAKPMDKTLVATVSGTNPGYGATVTALLVSALTILAERHNMPQSGGVLTTGAAFCNTDIIKRLHQNDLQFNIVTNENF